MSALPVTSEQANALKSTLQKIISDRDHSGKLAKMNLNPPDFEAWLSCQNTIESNLKAPSTADFVDRPGKNTFYDGDGHFRVQMRVDAENSFGAKLRSTFICRVHCSDLDHCLVTEVQ